MDDVREHGVGFAIRNSLLGTIEPCPPGSERLMTLRLNSNSGPVNLINAYAATLCAERETKDAFYSQINMVLNKIPKEELLVLMGDLNARVGMDSESWPSRIGKFGIALVNLTIMVRDSWYYAPTMTSVSPIHFSRHPRSKHWHQLDLIITRRSSLNWSLSLVLFTTLHVTPTTP